MYKTKQLTNAMLNMKSIFRFSLFLMMFIATLLSCSDDDGPGNGSGDKPTADTAQVIVLSHDKSHSKEFAKRISYGIKKPRQESLPNGVHQITLYHVN